MTAKAIFCECSSHIWLDVAERLTKEYNWEPCYWTAEPDFEQSVKKRFPDTVFHSNIDAARGTGAPACADLKLPALDQPLLKDLSFCESITLRMMNRMDRNDSFSYEERVRLYNSLVRYWTGILNHVNPDVVFFPVAPHLVYSYVLYELCKKKNIKTIMFELTSLTPFIFPVEKFEVGSQAIESMYETLMKSKNAKKVKLSENTEKHFKRMEGDYSTARPFYMKTNLEKQQVICHLTRKILKNPHNLPNMIKKTRYLFTRKHYIKQKGKKIENSVMKGWRYLFCKYEGKKKKDWLNRHYKKLTQDADFTIPYIYVPLHYQPERTTSPEGGVFANQLLMVDVLSKCTPEGWNIYVKEHPMQFKAVSSHGECSRTADFYDDLVALPNVMLIPISTSSFNLIDNAKAVATATGTIGWEAVLRQKPVMIFGHAWYKNCEGVFHTPTKEKCKSALSKIKAGYKVDKNLVKIFAHAIEQVGVKAYTESAYEKLAGISYKENVSNLTNTIQQFYKQIT